MKKVVKYSIITLIAICITALFISSSVKDWNECIENNTKEYCIETSR